MLNEKLELLNKEFTTLKSKIQTKLDQKDNELKQKDQALTKSNQEKQETITKLETALKENAANEKVLEQLIKEIQELTKQLN